MDSQGAPRYCLPGPMEGRPRSEKRTLPLKLQPSRRRFKKGPASPDDFDVAPLSPDDPTALSPDDFDIALGACLGATYLFILFVS